MVKIRNDQVKRKVANKVRANRVILSLVAVCLGFLITFSYQYTKKEDEPEKWNNREWERNLELHNQLVEIEERNRNLQKELLEKQQQIIDLETEMTAEQEKLEKQTQELDMLRKFLGKVAVKGEGIVVSLNDSEYNPEIGDINQFLVHEHHVLRVVNELYISGAEAIAINGKRLTANSYIVCNGPVISVDGESFPAPFVISAIGKADVLEKTLTIQGGVRDQLVNDNIVVKIEKKSEINLDPVF